jgi:ubiquinone/menaquinone biosynthesis C-methylase UbiE
MRRIDTPEILDSIDCATEDVRTTLLDLGRINRWFGGVATTHAMIERVAQATGSKHFSLLEVAAGYGDVPKAAAQKLARQDVTLKITLLDRARSHLLRDGSAVVADGLALPFADGSFDLVSCNLFAHHLAPQELARFFREAWRVCRSAVLVNDLVRHPVHLALVYAGFPLMRNRISRVDGVASVRRAYVPEEIRGIVLSAFSQGSSPRIEIFRHYLFRMGVIVWKDIAAAGKAENHEAAELSHR